MTNILDELKARLMADPELTCVIATADGEIIESRERGIKPLIGLILGGRDCKNGVAADRIVGKAAALLYAYMGVKKLYAAVMSAPAAAVCERHGVDYSYGVFTENIINRKGDDVCPMEKTVKDTDDPATAKELLISKLKTMGVI